MWFKLNARFEADDLDFAFMYLAAHFAALALLGADLEQTSGPGTHFDLEPE